MTTIIMENESKIRKIVFNDLTYGIALGGALLSCVFWIMNPQTELKLEITKLQGQVESNATVQEELSKIKNNDLHELQLRMDRIEARQVEQLQSNARIEALLTTKKDR